MGTEEVCKRFLRRQCDQVAALAAQSDMVSVLPVDSLSGSPIGKNFDQWWAESDGLFTRYVAEFRCFGLVRLADGRIARADRFAVGLDVAPDYLRRVNPYQVLTWLGPETVWHPNIGRPPGLDRVFICIGTIHVGTPLVELLYRTFETITYNNVAMSEHDALNADACVWARQNQHLFPVDRRPMKRRPLDFQVAPLEVEA